MVDSVEETEVLQKENTNKEPESGKAKTFSTPGNPTAQAGGSSAFGGRFSTIFGGGPSFVPPVATPVTGLSQSLPACLMPEPFNGSGDFEAIWVNLILLHFCLDGIAHVHTITDLNILHSD